jgi:hypothetical protein
VADASAAPGITPEEWQTWSAEALIDGRLPVDADGWLGAPPIPPGIASGVHVS